MIFGREEELESLADLMREPEFRAVVLVGPPGVGKSTLAEHALADLEHHELRVTATTTISQLDSAEADLVEAVGPGSVLFLDAAENAANAVATFANGTRSTRLLITSRTELPGVSFQRIEPLSRSASRDLFLELSDLPTESTNEAIDVLLEHLDDLPLAIELAASRTRVMSPEDMVERIHRRFDWVREPSREGRSLAAVLGEAWSMLDDREQAVLADLSVFIGSFTLAGAEAVSTRGDAAEAVVNVVERLVQKSLVREQGGQFSILDAVREFATSQVDNTEARRRMTAWLTSAIIELREFADRRSFEGHSPDLENLARDTRAATDARVRATYRWCQSNLHTTARSRGIGLLDATLSLELDDEQRGLLQLLRGQWRRDSGDLDGGHADLLRALETVRSCDWRTAEARALGALTVVAMKRSEYDDAERYGGAARDAFRSLGDSRGESKVLQALGIAAQWCGDVERSVRLYEEAAAIVSDSDRPMMYRIEGNLAAFRLASGDAEAAGETLRRLLEQPDLPARSRGSIGNNLALAELASGNLDAARATTDRVEAWNADVGRVETTQYVHLVRALIALEQDDSHRARVALTLARRTVDSRTPGENTTIIYAVSAIQAASDGNDEATKWLERATELASPSDAPIIALANAMVADQPMPPTVDRAAFVGPVSSTLYRVWQRHRGTRQRLTVNEDASWFQVAGEWNDLRRRGAMRRMLRALVEGQGADPIDAISLFERSWPDDTFDATNSVNRVYATLHRLRALGLEDFIETTDDGYKLADDLEVVRGEP